VLDETVPGYKQFVLRPQPGGSLTHARAKYCSPFGDIVSDWKIEDGVFKWHIIVPPNTRAKAYLPDLRNDATPMIAHELAAGKHYFEHIV
jgi:alpha-L-rhamnosidase